MTGKSHGGTPEWTAPEVLRSQNWNEKSDVYRYADDAATKIHQIAREAPIVIR